MCEWRVYWSQQTGNWFVSEMLYLKLLPQCSSYVNEITCYTWSHCPVDVHDISLRLEQRVPELWPYILISNDTEGMGEYSSETVKALGLSVHMNSY